MIFLVYLGPLGPTVILLTVILLTVIYFGFVERIRLLGPQARSQENENVGISVPLAQGGVNYRCEQQTRPTKS